MKTSVLATAFVMITSMAAIAQEATQAAPEGASATEGDTQIGVLLMAQARSEAQVTAALELQGYQIEDIRRSLLGRVIITARNEIHMREVVMSRSTGEILADRIVRAAVGSSNSTDAEVQTASSNAESRTGLGVELGADASADIESASNASGAGASVGGGIGASVSLGN